MMNTKQRLFELLEDPHICELIDTGNFIEVLKEAVDSAMIVLQDLPYLVRLFHDEGVPLTAMFNKPVVSSISAKRFSTDVDESTKSISTCYTSNNIDNLEFLLFMLMLAPHNSEYYLHSYVWVNGPTEDKCYPEVLVYCDDGYSDFLIADATEECDKFVEAWAQADGYTRYKFNSTTIAANVMKVMLRKFIDKEWSEIFEPNNISNLDLGDNL